MTTRVATQALRPLPGLRLVPAFGAVLCLVIAAGLGALAGEEPIIAVAVGVGALFALAVALKPDVATLIVVVALYGNAAAVAVKLHGLPYYAGAALPFALTVPLVYHLLVRRRRIVIASAVPWMLAFLGAQVVATLFSRERGAASDELVTFILEGIVLFVLITNVVRTSETLRRIVWLLLVVGALLAALSLYQQVTQTYSNDYLGFAQQSKDVFSSGSEAAQAKVLNKNVAGPIGNHARWAQILLMLVPLGLFRFWYERSAWNRLLAAGLTALIATGVLLTLSRGAAIGFVLMLVVGAFMRTIKLRQLVAVAAGITLLLFVVPTYRDRVSTLALLPGAAGAQGSSAREADTSIRSRATENLAAGLIFLDNPAVGVGPGGFPSAYLRYADRVGDFRDQLDIRLKTTERQAHNLYLSLLAETGVLGLGTFLAIVFVSLRDLVRARRRWLETRPELASMATAFLLGIVTYLGTGVFLHLAYQRYFWLMLALAAAASAIALREPEGEKAAEAPADRPRIEGPAGSSLPAPSVQN